jgi:hydroxymethylpyrimidine kinase/phosphomethylpyrimidine kinase
MNAFGVFATTALTAVTAQNTLGVSAIANIDPDVVEAQIRSVAEDFELRATKTGMLAQAATVRLVAGLAKEGILPHLVVDPVLVATSGDVLMAEGGIEAYQHDLFPHAEVVTPNLREAAVLCGVDVKDVRTLDDVEQLAHLILAMGPTYVLVKGGHLESHHPHRSVDLLLSHDGLVVLEGPRVTTKNDHGTGCSLSSAIAAGLALNRSVTDATRDAKSFVLAGLEGAAQWHLGEGRGPIDHLGWDE